MSGRLAGWLTFVAVLAALNYASRFAAESPAAREGDFFYRWDFFAGGAVQMVVTAGLVYLIVRGGPAAQLLALRRPRSWAAAAGWMLVVIVGISIVSLVLNPFLHPGEEQGLVPERWRPEDAAPFAANLGLTALAVPIVEELTFRGAGYSLLARFGPPLAIVGTGVLFGVAHGLVLALPVLVAFGIGLAWLRSRTGSVFPCILLHGMFNAFAVLVGVFA